MQYCISTNERTVNCTLRRCQIGCWLLYHFRPLIPKNCIYLALLFGEFEKETLITCFDSASINILVHFMVIPTLYIH